MDNSAHQPATKADLHKIAVGLVRTRAELREFKMSVEKNIATKIDISRVLNAIDKVLEKGQAYDLESKQ
jgi:hypothetical protein